MGAEGLVNVVAVGLTGVDDTTSASSFGPGDAGRNPSGSGADDGVTGADDGVTGAEWDRKNCGVLGEVDLGVTERRTSSAWVDTG